MSTQTSGYHHLHQKCVCEMCNCGKHKCPKPHLKGDFHTSYEKDYPNHQGGSPTQSFKKNTQYQPCHYDPSHMVSNYQSEFIPKEGGQRPVTLFSRNGKSSIQQQGLFEGESAYNQSYKQFSGNYNDLRAKVLNRQKAVNSGRFEGQSRYVQDFTGVSSPPRSQIKARGNLEVGEGKFDGQSTYNKNYLGQSSLPQRKIVPQGNLSVSDGRFDGSSTYNQNYAGTRGIPAQKVHLKNQIQLQEGKFNGESTYNNNYIGTSGVPSSMIIGRGQLNLSDAVFNPETTYNQNYDYKGIRQVAEVEKPRSRKDLLRNDNKNYNEQSSYTANYVGGVAQKSQQIVPKGQISLGSQGNFQGQSQYANTYKGLKPELRNPIRPSVGNNITPIGIFQGGSSYNAHYTEAKGAPRQAIKKSDAPLNDGPFNGQTTYGDQYNYKQSQRIRCPVEALNPPKSNQLDQEHMRFNSRLGVWV